MLSFRARGNGASLEEYLPLTIWWSGLAVLLWRGNTVFEGWATLFVSLWSGALLILSHLFLRDEPVRLPRTLALALAVLLGAALASSAGSVNPDASAKELARLMSVAAMLLALPSLFRAPRRWDLACRGLIALVIIIIGISVVTYLREGPPSADHRLLGPFAWWNQMGGFLAISLPLLATAFFLPKARGRAAAGLAALLLALGALLLTASRGSWLTALVTFPASLLALRPRLPRLAAFGGALAAAGMLSFLIMPDTVRSLGARALTIVRETKPDARSTSGSIRADALFVAARALQSRPLLGTGPGTFEDTFVRFQVAPWRFAAHAHNEAAEMTTELGLIGGGAFVVLLATLGHSALRALRHAFRRGPLHGKRRRTLPVPKATLAGAAVGASLLAAIIHLLLDVDWSFVGLEALFGTLAALLLTRPTTPPTAENEGFDAAHPKRMVVIPRAVVGSVAAVTIVFGAWLGAETALNRLFVLRLAHNDLSGATRAAETLGRVNPWSDQALRLLGQIWFLRQELAPAEAALEAAARLAPWRADPLIALGELDEWRNDRRRARERYAEAIARSRFQTPYPTVRIARLLRAAGQPAEAEQLLAEAVEASFPLNEDFRSLTFLRRTRVVRELAALYQELSALYQERGKVAEARALAAQWNAWPDLPPLSGP